MECARCGEYYGGPEASSLGRGAPASVPVSRQPCRQRRLDAPEQRNLCEAGQHDAPPSAVEADNSSHRLVVPAAHSSLDVETGVPGDPIGQERQVCAGKTRGALVVVVEDRGCVPYAEEWAGSGFGHVPAQPG